MALLCTSGGNSFLVSSSGQGTLGLVISCDWLSDSQPRPTQIKVGYSRAGGLP